MAKRSTLLPGWQNESQNWSFRICDMWIERSWSIINSKGSSCVIMYNRSPARSRLKVSPAKRFTSLLLVRVLAFSDVCIGTFPLLNEPLVTIHVGWYVGWRFYLWPNYLAYNFMSTEYSSRAKSSHALRIRTRERNTA